VNSITIPAGPQGPTALEAALVYHRRGWSVIAIAAGTKKPPKGFRWQRFQKTRPTEQELWEWFDGGDELGLAVILGPVSGGLVCRDFDVMETYNAWANSQQDLAATLPTVATARGRHVYFVANVDKITKLADGELRGAGYCVLPPSRHPSGSTYKWRVPLPDGPLPWVDDVVADGLVSAPVTENNGDNREILRATEGNRASEVGSGASVASVSLCYKGGGASSLTLDPNIEKVILQELPARIGRRNEQVRELARALKAIPLLADAPGDNLEPLVRHWHRLGVEKGVIGTVPFEESWIDFLRIWPIVKFPKGAEPMVAIFANAKQAVPPRAADKYESQDIRLLIALCRELQKAAGDRPFFLSCRTAGRLLGVSHVAAWRWLFLLQHDHVIDEVEKGDPGKRRASRYYYLGD
jgi:hypothetical protein